MPLAPFIGLNNHRHSIFFGMTLLRHETAQSFCWLFEIWLKTMHDKHPRTITTDQDPAMRKTIEKIFPNIILKCCQWYVMRKAREQIGSIIADKDGFSLIFYFAMESVCYGIL
jgi:MULE transposase domain